MKRFLMYFFLFHLSASYTRTYLQGYSYRSAGAAVGRDGSRGMDNRMVE